MIFASYFINRLSNQVFSKNSIFFFKVMGNTKQLVLQSFKKLHKTRLKVFAGDLKALTAARMKINDEYKKNKNVNDEKSILAMIKFGEDIERELKTQIIQAREKSPGVYEARITDETIKLENIPFNNKAIPNESTPGGGPCCQDAAKNNN